MKKLFELIPALYSIGAFGTFNYIFFFSHHSFLEGPITISAAITLFCSVGWPVYWIFQLF